MSFDEFLLVLSTSNNDFTWSIRENSFVLRAQYNDFTWCPITAVCRIVTGRSMSAVEWTIAARDLNLASTLACSIVDAADDAPIQESHIREQLLKAVGLK